MKILICQFGNETNTFVKGRLSFEKLVPDGWVPAGEVVSRFSGTQSFLGGALKAIREYGAEPLPIDLLTIGGNFGAGPLMSAECASYAVGSICEEIKKKEGQYDGIYFALHGGGACEQDEDLESFTLRAIRKVTGPDVPIMCSMDLHANLTEEMVRLADGLFSIKCVPHTDCVEAGYLAASTLIRTLRGEVRPLMAFRKIPMLVSSSVGSTMSGPAKEVKDYVEAYKKEHGLIDCAFIHGFSSMDRSCSSSSVLVVADGHVPDKEAAELANFVWDRHEKFVADSLTAEQAFDKALSLLRGGYVVINESSDNPGSGCPGDGTHLLREFIRRDRPRTIMGPIYDEEAAELIHGRRVGDRISFDLGGKTEDICGAPIKVDEAEIMNLSNGRFVSAAPINKGVQMNYGKSARLRLGNVEFIVVSRRFQVYDDRPFIMTGCDMTQYDIIGLKSMNHFRGYFAPIADGIVAADTPGLRPADLRKYDYKYVKRPIFPLDEDVSVEF